MLFDVCVQLVIRPKVTTNSVTQHIDRKGHAQRRHGEEAWPIPRPTQSIYAASVPRIYHPYKSTKFTLLWRMSDDHGWASPSRPQRCILVAWAPGVPFLAAGRVAKPDWTIPRLPATKVVCMTSLINTCHSHCVARLVPPVAITKGPQLDYLERPELRSAPYRAFHKPTNLCSVLPLRRRASGARSRWSRLIGQAR